VAADEARFAELRTQAQLGSRLRAMQEHRAGAEVRAHAEAKAGAESQTQAGGGKEYWWLKDLPWWMPPPPEWGPLPPTMYNAYYHQTFKPPLSTPNYYPLFTRVEDLDAPLGHAAPLPVKAEGNPLKTPADLEPPVAVPNLTPNPTPTAPQRFAEVLPPRFEQTEATQPIDVYMTPVFLETATSVRGADETTATSPFGPGYFGFFGPRNLQEHLAQPQEIPVPYRLRFDRQLLYQSHWDLLEAAHADGSPYEQRYAPLYRPLPLPMLRRLVPDPKATYEARKHFFFRKPYAPSVFEEPTQFQIAKEQEIGAQEDAAIAAAGNK
jgi:hypothetical protein